MRRLVMLALSVDLATGVDKVTGGPNVATRLGALVQ